MSELSRAEAKQRIHEAGLRATAPRLAVLRLLSRAEKPLSHSEVVEELGSATGDQATLYRNLLKLVEAELARVANRIGGITRYEVQKEDEGPHLHPHFSCKQCGKVSCLPEAKLAGPVDRAWHPSLAEADLQLVGTCPDCRSA